MKKINYIRIAIGTIFILLIPLILRWPWDLADFIIMGILVSGTGFILDWVNRKVDKNYRYIVWTAVLGIALAIWSEMAVGAIEHLLESIF